MNKPNIALTILAKNERPFQVFENDGEKRIGAEPGEAFLIKVESLDDRRREIIVSVDGTNVLTGQPATPDDQKRFILEPHRPMILRAWPESDHAGREFVFTEMAASVAHNAHGETSQVGTISVLSFVETYVAPPPAVRRGGLESFNGGGTLGGGGYGSATRGGGFESTRGGGFESTRGGDADGLESFGGNAKSASAVGAGQKVEQRLTTARGLTRPEQEGAAYIRHTWWTELEAILRRNNVSPAALAAPPPGFFPGGQLANLSRVPTATPGGRVPTQYSRFAQ